MAVLTVNCVVGGNSDYIEFLHFMLLLLSLSPSPEFASELWWPTQPKLDTSTTFLFIGFKKDERSYL